MDMAEVTAEAAERVAAGINSTAESAAWSVTYRAGYVDGRAHAWHGSGRCADSEPEGYRAGFARGYAWGVAHPLAARAGDGRYVNEATARQIVAGYHADGHAGVRAHDMEQLAGWYPVMLGDTGAWVGRVRRDATTPFFVRYGAGR